MRFGKETLKDYESSISKEYLITNGIGGYCSSTICGSNIRKYSALLVAAVNPPVERRLMLSKLDETIIVDNKEIDIYSNEKNGKLTDKGYMYEVSFENEYFPAQNFIVEGMLISKKITMKYGENTTVVSYCIHNNSKEATIKIKALINNRDHHDNTKIGDFKCTQYTNSNGTSIEFDINELRLYLLSDKAFYKKTDQWYEDMFYYNENQRGLMDLDNHYIPGVFELSIKPYEKIEFSIIASTSPINEVCGEKYFKLESERKAELLRKLTYRDNLSEMLALAADQFIVKRKSTNTATVIAGYPWFTDWGRDTMIALPGLTLCTGRYEEAKELLITFAKYVKYGLIPNMFPDNDVEPIYNTIDASLWYFNAVYKYLEYTKDYEFISEYIFETLTEILKQHLVGTKYSISMDKNDGLLTGGDKDTQLTWMDVKIMDWAVTPRQGKAVEINALWYNAICIYIELSEKYGASKFVANIDLVELQDKIKINFIDKFWNKEKNYFYDYIDDSDSNNVYCDDKIRPNAIIALSLPYTLVQEDIARKIMSVALEKLYTPYGLRSLSPEDEEYIGLYLGDLVARDSAYHQGTVWSWLIGPFISAINKWYKDKALCRILLEPFYDHLKDRCVGSISEVFDGDVPYNPRACYAQAWGNKTVLSNLLIIA